MTDIFPLVTVGTYSPDDCTSDEAPRQSMVCLMCRRAVAVETEVSLVMAEEGTPYTPWAFYKMKMSSTYGWCLQEGISAAVACEKCAKKTFFYGNSGFGGSKSC